MQLKWNEPDVEGLVAYLCGDKQFNEDRIRNGAKKLHKARNTETQGRLDGFFTVLSPAGGAKRKVSGWLLYCPVSSGWNKQTPAGGHKPNSSLTHTSSQPSSMLLSIMYKGETIPS